MRTRPVVFVVYPGVQSLDVLGPLEVFATANRFVDGAYRTTLTSVRDERVGCSSGVELGVHQALASVRGEVDTLLVAGGEGTPAAAADDELLAGVRRMAARSRRVASVCSGAFVLAAAGLLDGRRATTHWQHCELLDRAFPKVRVEPDPIYVRDGDVWTSAGVTAGMDLALALVEDDLGRDVALRVARQLVLFLHRPGGQAQFSAQLAGQMADRDWLRDLQRWIADHPHEHLTVAALAERAAMSERHLTRVFRDELGTTPARYVEQVRLEVARRHLEESDDAVDVVARHCGFGTTETMRRTFLRHLRCNPSQYRSRFRTGAA